MALTRATGNRTMSTANDEYSSKSCTCLNIVKKFTK